jgi:hypothetical protein
MRDDFTVFFPTSSIPLRRTDKGARWRWACSFLIEAGHKMGHTVYWQLSRAVRWQRSESKTETARNQDWGTDVQALPN